MSANKTITPAEDDDVHVVPPPNIELWNATTVRAFFGGDKPLNMATLYRGVHSGRFPKPINVSANLVRWIASECRATLSNIIERRDAGERTTPRHGGRKKQAA